MIASLTLNGRALGERFLYIDAAGRLLLRREEALQLTALAGDVATVTIDGEPHIALGDLPGAELRFDERALTVELLLPPEAFQPSVFVLDQRREAAVTSGQRSLLLNYRLGYTGQDGGPSIWSLATEQGVRFDAWLLRNQTFHLRGAGFDSNLRYETQLVRDERASMTRLIVGDSFIRPGELGAAVPIGGLSFSRAYELAPYFLPQPSVNFAGTVQLPSEVELYVGGNRVFERRIEPGPFEITNVNYYGGLQDVVMVIRDALGREQVIEYPFYFSDSGLAAGLDDYSYHIGVLRESLGARSGDYGALAWSGRHRYGLSDTLTIGGEGQGGADYGHLGPSLVYRSNHFGVVGLSAAASWARGRGGSGAWSASYSYQAGPFSVRAAARAYGDGFRSPSSSASFALPERDLNLAVAYAPRPVGSVSLGYSARDWRDGDSLRSFTLSYSRRLLQGLSLLVAHRRVSGDSADFLAAGSEWSLALFYLPRSGQSYNTTWRRDADRAQVLGVQYGSRAPSGLGPSYRLSASREQADTGTRETLAPELQYDGRLATLAAQAQTSSGATSQTRYALSLAGSLAALEGYVGLSRPITDSFALARVEPPLSGVQVYQSNREVGRTGDDGTVLIPELASFVDNYVAIEDRDIPIEYSVERTRQTVSPGFRSGALVRFAVKRMRSIAGVVRYRDGGSLRPLEYHRATLDSGMQFVTGRGGDFYIEDLAAGSHMATVQLARGRCRFALDVPQTDEPFITLGEELICEQTD
ncbi:MAG: fimbria/pilus outer membrane usher protein [Gammaproteobacteria bacterium]